ncbi:MAG: hypothetical protein FK731_05980 [Asgard group archaeon]|nr:hypothetical protein [Asgard group archaeon]
MIKISQIDSNKDLQTIIDYFFNQIESDVFFGYHRFKESQITDSNIMLNFLYNYEIKNSQSMIIKFNILVVRNLIDYIKWRLNHFKALPENIIKSLMSVRKKIYSSEGELGNIVNVEWNLEEKLPKKVIVQNQKTNKIDEFSPANLFQGKENLQLNTKQENRIYSALRNFSQHFLKSLKNYFVSQSCIAIIEKINQSKIAFYENLIGKNIKNTIELQEHFQNQIA